VTSWIMAGLNTIWNMALFCAFTLAWYIWMAWSTSKSFVLALEVKSVDPS